MLGRFNSSRDELNPNQVSELNPNQVSIQIEPLPFARMAMALARIEACEIGAFASKEWDGD